MDINTMSRHFERIEEASKRKKIVEYTAELFKICKDESLDTLVSIIELIAGTINIKTEIGEMIIVKGLDTFFNTKVREHVVKLGSVGEATKFLLLTTKTKPMSLDAFVKKEKKVLSVEELLDEIIRIANVSGAGSISKKQRMINNLIRDVHPTTAKYIINIILGQMRIGASEKTIIEAITLLYGTKKDKVVVEQMYNMNPNFEALIYTIEQHGIGKAFMNLETPVNMMLAGRIQYTDILKQHKGQTFAQYKYDGERVQIHKNGDRIFMYSRDLANVSDRYPELIEELSFISMNFVIEGEVVAVEDDVMLPFQVLGQRRRKHDIEDYVERVPVKLFVFDILLAGVNQVMHEPYSSRWRILRDVASGLEKVELATGTIIEDEKELVKYFEKARKDGAEGLVCKNQNSPYKPGKRTKDWIKMKNIEGSKMNDTIDVAIVGAQYGKGKRKGLFSTLFVAIENEELEFFCRVGSGLDDETLLQITESLEKHIVDKNDVKLGRVKPDVLFDKMPIIEIEGDEISTNETTPHGYSIRFPVFKRFRPDKKRPATLDEIEKMYKKTKR